MPRRADARVRRRAYIPHVFARRDRLRAKLHHSAAVDVPGTPLAQDGAIRVRASHRMKVADLELCGPMEGLTGLDGYQSARLLVRLGGTPLGWTTVPVIDGHCDARTLIA